MHMRDGLLEDPNDDQRTRRWPVRLILVAIVFALVLPGAIFSTILLSRIARTERVHTIENARAAAERTADTLDREIGNLAAALVALGTSPALDTPDAPDLPAFTLQARAVAAALGHEVVLCDTAGQQRATSREPPPVPLPAMGSPETVTRAVATAATAVSGLFRGGSDGALSLAVDVPVMRNGRVVFVLGTNIRPAAITDLLREQGLPEGWLVAITDANNTILARSLNPEQQTGQQASQDFLAHAVGDHATWFGTSLEGAPVLVAMQRQHLADWRVGVGVSLDVIETQLRTTIALLAAGGVVTLLLTCLIAWRLADLVALPLRRLSHAGEAINQGLPVLGVRSSIAEVYAVSRALVLATRNLESQVADRTGALQDANQRLRDEMAARTAAEDQLRQAQKMEAVGQLTGGIAHDFNNLLTVIVGSLDLLRRRVPEGEAGERPRRLLENALDAANRAAILTARLLAFSRRQPLMPQPVDANRLVSGMVDLLHRTLGETVQVETVLAGGLWQVNADPNQLENALLNLAVNGRDAMLAYGTGTLTITTANIALDAQTITAMIAQDPDMAPGDYVRVSVRDTGAGMEPDVAARVFEPFYTTKPLGQGTGLGLSQVQGFVKQTGGHVTIRTAPGHGTTVSIDLPRFTGPAASPDTSIPEPTQPSLGTLTVLVVEDEAGVRRVSTEALRELGHIVLEAPDAAAALRLLDAHPEVTLLFTDVILPKMEGPVLAAEARRRRPDLPVLFTSGYTGKSAMGLSLGADDILLSKPFNLDALAAALAAALAKAVAHNDRQSSG